MVLLDLQLPSVDGLDLVRLVREDINTRDLLIIAVTAYAMKGDEERARAAGIDDYVTKPIDTRQLPKVIAQRLAARGVRDRR